MPFLISIFYNKKSSLIMYRSILISLLLVLISITLSIAAPFGGGRPRYEHDIERRDVEDEESTLYRLPGMHRFGRSDPLMQPEHIEQPQLSKTYRLYYLVPIINTSQFLCYVTKIFKFSVYE